MGLFQKAVETYDYLESKAGVETEGKSTLAPIGFISAKVQIAVTLKENGDFVKAERIFEYETDEKGKTVNKEKKIIIPSTEESAGRSSGGAKTTPHPLCDKLMYLCPDNKDSFDAYINQLEDWCNSEFSVPAIRTVLQYVKKGEIRNDISSVGDVKDEEFICWRVLSLDLSESEDLWKNESVINSYTRFCQSEVNKLSDKNFCYVFGDILPEAEQHLKGIVSFSGNAKLISANDSSNFTYRGRFLDDKEALTVSFTASQKAHNALKYVISNDGVRFGDRTLVCWNTKGKKPESIIKSLFSKVKDDNKPTPNNYREMLRKAVFGLDYNFNPDDNAVTAIFEAATTGRLSVSYYSEMKAADFIERLIYWDESCAWIHSSFGVTSPDLRKIADAAFGTVRTNENMQSIETDDSVLADTIQRLILCRLEKSPFPADIMRAAVNKCSALQLYNDDGLNNRRNQLFTTCSIIKKYKYDHFKEEYSMALEPEKKNRSYQFGRLLAVMEKAERDTYESSEKRETNAIRMQSFFVKRPMHTARLITEQLKNAYYPHLSVGARSYYDKLIGEIMLQISESDDYGKDKPLTEEYLMGYYLQKNALYTKKNNENNDNESEDNE